MPIRNELAQAAQQDNIQTLARDGSLIVPRVFTNEEIEQIKSALFDHFKANDQEDPYAVRNLLHEIPC
jgi:23S rRNA U2552 (ribose-2'-O)-methylase RlmE/FtsJ